MPVKAAMTRAIRVGGCFLYIVPADGVPCASGGAPRPCLLRRTVCGGRVPSGRTASVALLFRRRGKTPTLGRPHGFREGQEGTAFTPFLPPSEFRRTV